MIKISIIVPIYNASKYLNKCINSLTGQTLKDIEILLINDGSTDKSEEIINSFVDKRIKYYKNKNQGIGKTRNFGIDRAKGKYLMFVDSDDYIDNDMCRKMYAKAEKEKLEVVICDFYRDTNRELEPVTIKNFKNTTLKENPNLLLDINLAPWNKLYKKDLIDKNSIRFEEELKYEDAPFVVNSLANAKKIGKVNDYLSYYCIHGNSETTIRDKRIFDILEIIKILRNILGKKEYIKEQLDHLTVRMITNYTIQQRYQSNKEIRNSFIDESFMYLEKTVPDYKNNKYYTNRGMLKRTIEKSKILTKIYCAIYNVKNKI